MGWWRNSGWISAWLIVGCGGGGGAEGGSSSSSADESTSSGEATTSADPSSGSIEESSTGAGPVGGSIHGAVEKGPFILGSELELAMLDAAAAPTGQTFPASVVDDLGTFEIAVPGELAWASASGFHFDEVSGVLSGAELTLHALVVIDAAQVERHLNVLTDLSAERARTLVESGVAPTDALAQAGDELVAALPLGVGHVPSVGFESLAIFGAGGLDEAYLLAVSATVLQAAHDDAPDPPPDATAQLQARLNGIALDLADDGALANSTIDELRLASHRVDADAVLAHLQARADELGVPFVAPPLLAMLDQDEDGVADAEDNCVGVVNPDQADEDGDDEGDVCEGCSDPSLPDADGDGVREPCDNCTSPNASQTDGDGDGIGNPCDSCPMTPEGESGPCCDPRQAATWCVEPDGSIQNTGCSDGEDGFACDYLVDGSLAGFGDWCLGGCNGFGATCVVAEAFPDHTDPVGSDCTADQTCCSRYCTVGADAMCALGGLESVMTCVPYYAAGEAPAGLETLGVCADTTNGPCAVPGAHGRACAKGLE